MLEEPLLAPHLFLIFDLSSVHPSLPVLYFLSLPLNPFYLFVPSLCVPVSSSLPSCHPVQHLFLSLTFPGSRQQCLSLLQLGVAAAQEADLTRPLCSIHQLACRAGVPADTTHSVSLHFNTSRRPLYTASTERTNATERDRKETFNLCNVIKAGIGELTHDCNLKRLPIYNNNPYNIIKIITMVRIHFIFNVKVFWSYPSFPGFTFSTGISIA